MTIWFNAPWTIRDIPDYGEDCVRALVIIDATGNEVAVVATGIDCDDPDAMAIARLFEKAPETLYALKQLRFNQVHGNGLEEQHKAIDRAAFLIEYVTGGLH